MGSSPIRTMPPAERWRAAVNQVVTLQRAERGLRQTAGSGVCRPGLFERDVYLGPKTDRTKGSGRTTDDVVESLRVAVANALEARDVLGNDPDQVIPGVREYLFPEPIEPIKGLKTLRGLMFGPRGFLRGIQEMFVERRLGRGFAKALASAVFMPFQLIAVAVDAPRFAGDHIVEAGKRHVIGSIRFDGMKQSLHTMLGGAIQMAGGVVRLALPAAIVAVGILSTGWAGVLGAAIFEAVYLGEDLAKLGSGEHEEMLLFRALRDVVSGIATIFGAEFIHTLKRELIEPQLSRLPANQIDLEAPVATMGETS